VTFGAEQTLLHIREEAVREGEDDDDDDEEEEEYLLCTNKFLFNLYTQVRLCSTNSNQTHIRPTPTLLTQYCSGDENGKKLNGRGM
jgi:hypothetical protein